MKVKKKKRTSAKGNLASQRRSKREPGPEQFAGHLLLAISLLMFVKTVWEGHTFLSASPDHFVFDGANGNPYTIANRQWWRLASTLFLHTGVVHLIVELWAMLSLTSSLSRHTGGRSMLIVFFFSGLAAGAAGLAFYPAAQIMIGACGAIAGLAGAWMGLAYLGRVKFEDLSHGGMLALVLLVAYNCGFSAGPLQTPLEIFTLVSGALAGFIAVMILGMTKAKRSLRVQVQVGLALLFVCAGLTYLVPQKQVSYLEGSSKISTPLEMVELDMMAVIESYDRVGQMASGGQVQESRMADMIRADLIPGLSRVQAKLEVIKPDGEGERRKIELDRKLVTALLNQVTAMAKYAAGKDPKQNELVEHWTKEARALSLEWRRLNSAPREPATN